MAMQCNAVQCNASQWNCNGKAMNCIKSVSIEFSCCHLEHPFVGVGMNSMNRNEWMNQRINGWMIKVFWIDTSNEWINEWNIESNGFQVNWTELSEIEVSHHHHHPQHHFVIKNPLILTSQWFSIIQTSIYNNPAFESVNCINQKYQIDFKYILYFNVKKHLAHSASASTSTYKNVISFFIFFISSSTTSTSTFTFTCACACASTSTSTSTCTKLKLFILYTFSHPNFHPNFHPPKFVHFLKRSLRNVHS